MDIPKTPEEFIQAMMQVSGKSRSEVEAILGKALGEIQMKANQAKSRKTSKPHKEYTQTSYPHYLPAKQVLKYTLRITLKGIKPAIWRKIEVPSNITLRHLGDLIVELMGWEGYHLNQFYKGDDYYMPHYQRDSSGEDDFFWDCNNYDQEEFTIADLLVRKASTVTFEYDFGDSWEHDVRLSSIDEYKADEPHRINFVSGECACPPEDCGGVWGYEELLEILAKRKARKRLTSEEKEHLEWAGWDADYDPDFLDLEECRQIVEGYN